MKKQIGARVISHKLYTPSKDNPDLELGVVELMVFPLATASPKNTKAKLIVEKDDLWESFALGRLVTITLEDYQQEMDLEAGDEKGDDAFARSQVTLQIPGQPPVTASGRDMKKALERVKGDRSRLKH